MTLLDAKGAKLQATNPMVAPRLDFTPPADGDYTLAVEHLHYWGGPDETYRVTVVPYGPAFDRSVTLDHFGVPPKFRAIGFVGLGHPTAADPASAGSSAFSRRRRPIEELVHRNHWSHVGGD